jgi:hypothetical protein
MEAIFRSEARPDFAKKTEGQLYGILNFTVTSVSTAIG